MKSAVYFGLAVFGFSGMATISNAATAVSSSLNVSAFVDIDTSDNVPGAQNSQYSVQAGTLDQLVVGIAVSQYNSSTGDFGTATTSATATWSNANSGLVSFYNMGWSLSTSTPTFVKLNEFNSGSKVWEYTFVADGNGLFEMVYDVSGTGDTFGLLGASIDWTGPGGGLYLYNAFDPAASGVFTRSIVAGQQYTISVSNSANISAPAGTVREGYFSGTFEWRITEGSVVPGPAAALPFLGGLLVSLKRRRK